MIFSSNDRAFTLVELLVAMAVSSVVLGIIYSTYQAQLKSQVTQQQVVEMQQNARAAMFAMEREIRLAGYDDQRDLAGAQIRQAKANFIEFSMNIHNGLDDDGDTNIDEFDERGIPNVDTDTDDDYEHVQYRLSNDADDDGRADGLECNLERRHQQGGPNNWSSWVSIASNIDALNFVYLDNNGIDLVDYGLSPPEVPAGKLADIRSVQITIVARAGANPRHRLPNNKIDTRVYMNQQDRPGDDWDIILPAPNDRFRRIVLSADILCRNL